MAELGGMAGGTMDLPGTTAPDCEPATSNLISNAQQLPIRRAAST
jgi:hypothetical protein